MARTRAKAPRGATGSARETLLSVGFVLGAVAGCARSALSPDREPPQADFGLLVERAIVATSTVPMAGSYWGEESELWRFRATADGVPQSCTWGRGSWDCGLVSLIEEGEHMLALELVDRAGNVARPSLRVVRSSVRTADTLFGDPAGVVRLESLSTFHPLGLSWGDIGGPNGPVPDGTPDLLISSTQDRGAAFVVADGSFADAAFVPSSLLEPLAYAGHAITAGPSLASGRPEAIALASIGRDEALLLWSSADETYLDLAADTVVAEDNAIIGG